MKRRDFLLFAVGASTVPLVMTSCDRKDVQRSIATGVAIAAIYVGERLIQLPHPVAKVIGIALRAGGTTLLVRYEDSDGSEYELELLLDEPLDHLDDGEVSDWRAVPN